MPSPQDQEAKATPSTTGTPTDGIYHYFNFQVAKPGDVHINFRPSDTALIASNMPSSKALYYLLKKVRFNNFLSYLFCSQIKVYLPASHSYQTSLSILYPFCNCFILHCLYVEYHSPFLSHAARCMYRPFNLWQILPRLRSPLFNVSPELQKKVLCLFCMSHPRKFLTF